MSNEITLDKIKAEFTKQYPKATLSDQTLLTLFTAREKSLNMTEREIDSLITSRVRQASSMFYLVEKGN
jgi:hypothetical protein